MTSSSCYTYWGWKNRSSNCSPDKSYFLPVYTLGMCLTKNLDINELKNPDEKFDILFDAKSQKPVNVSKKNGISYA